MMNDVAIIHAGRDSEIAAAIAARLRRHGVDVWTDPESLVWRRTPRHSVEESILNSRVALLICSPALMEASWDTGGEAATVMHYGDGPRARILPVMVEPCELPTFLRHLVYFDMTAGSPDDRMVELVRLIDQVLRKRTLFICHSSRDKAEVLPLVRSLKRRRQLALWYDDDSLKPGSIIRRGIEAGISKADYLLAVLSKNAIDSIEGWIGFELDQAYERERQRNLKGHYFVIPVLIASKVEMPPWLSTKVHVDLTKGFDDGVRAIVSAVSMPMPAD